MTENTQGASLREEKKKKEKEGSPTGKILSMFRSVLVWLVVLAAVSMMIFTIISVSTFDRNDRDLFGFQAYIVRTDSMSATDFTSGDLILIKEVDPATLQAGDIIAFISQNTSNFGEVVTHKIRSLTTDAEGNLGFITYGTTTDTDDESVVTYGYVLGKYQAALPGVGTFFTFLKTTPGYICCILLPFLLLIVIQGVNSVNLFRQYRQEQTDELQAQRDQIAAEREEAQKMMAELQKMRSEMGLEPKETGSPGDEEPLHITTSD